MQQVIDLYVKAVDLAKQGEELSNQDKMILNKFKILLLSGATGHADRELAQIGKVRKDTLHKVRELAESIFRIGFVVMRTLAMMSVRGFLKMVRNGLTLQKSSLYQN